MNLVRKSANAQQLVDTTSHTSLADDVDAFASSQSFGARAPAQTQSVLVETSHALGVGYRAEFASGKDVAPQPQYYLDPSSGTAGNGKTILNWDEAAEQLTRYGTSWSPSLGQGVVITYAYRLSDPGEAIRPGDADGFSQFNAAQIQATEAALRLWADIANITFVRVGSGTEGPGAYSDSAAILFANYATGLDGATGWGYYPSPGATGDLAVQGDVWINSSYPEHLAPVFGGYGPHLLAHEIGHAIGLQHPGEYDSTNGGPITYANDAEYFQDSRAFTTMSYFGSGVVGHALGAFAAGPMLHDIAAAQRLYGANMSTRTGDTTYGFNSNTGLQFFTVTSATDRPIFAVWDAGGIDTFDFSIYSTSLELDLREEAFSSVGLASNGVDGAIGNISIARGVVIENAIGGSGSDLIIGNAAANWLVGNDGADTLVGGLGVDTLNGGAGNDTFVYAIGDGNGVMNGGADNDTLNLTDGTASSILNANFNGTSLIALSGNGLTSIETINANMGGGVDWLIYAAASAAVTVNLATGSASGFTTLSGVERVVGGNGDDTLTGDNLDNRLEGGFGVDTLSGAGGVDALFGGDGADVINGGLGNDSIDAGAGNDVISWAYTDGRDTINGGADIDTLNMTGAAVNEIAYANWNGTSLTGVWDNGVSNLESINIDMSGGQDWLIYNTTFAVSVNLALGTGSGFNTIANVERVVGGSGGDTLTGDGFDNRLDGQAGNDTLDGGGGSDSVLGGDGDDIIYASAGNDSLQGQAGNDAFHWTTADGRDTFNGGADFDTVNITGSAIADVADANWNGTAITGLLNNALVDIEAIHLNLGDGGSGGDWLRYNTSLSVTVDLGAGAATGFASISGVENLIGGLGGDTLIGDAGSNKINGNTGDDIITGGGGADNLTGGMGSDTFVYAAGAGNDTINDFDAWAVGGQDFLDVTAFGINAGNFASRIAIIDVGADTVIRIDGTYFITLKNVSGDGDNVITSSDFILAA